MSKVAKKTEATTEVAVAVEAKNVPVLVIKSEPAVRAGTAAEAVWNAIKALCGSAGAEGAVTREAVLIAAKAAETNWHKEAGRVVKAVAPAGWLRKWAACIAFE